MTSPLMTSHVTRLELDRYLTGAMSEEASARLERHVALCVSCRARVDDRVALLVRTLEPAVARADQDHIGDEDMAAYVDGALGGERRDTVEAHIALCAQCDRDKHALEDERDAIVAPAPTPVPVRWPALAAVAAGLTAAVLAGGWWLQRPTPLAPALVRGTAASPMAPAPAPAAPAKLALTDGTHRVQVDADGQVTGLDAFSPEAATVLAAALTSGSLDVTLPAALRVHGTDVLMGNQPAGPAAVLSPAGDVLETDRPEFTWSAVAGASSYTVTVFDPQLRPVATSPALIQRRWMPSDPLPRGAVYVWQVSASTASGAVVVPAPPAPDARFGVVDSKAAAALQAARAAGSPLAVGVLSARAGLLADAERALLQLADENPDSKLVAHLLQQVRDARR